MADQRIIVPEKKIITNASLADRAVAFISALKHTKGEWHGKNFELLPWQEKVVRDVFGTVKEPEYCPPCSFQKKHSGSVPRYLLML